MDLGILITENKNECKVRETKIKVLKYFTQMEGSADEDPNTDRVDQGIGFDLVKGRKQIFGFCSLYSKHIIYACS